jgi:hypothetical protein
MEEEQHAFIKFVPAEDQEPIEIYDRLCIHCQDNPMKKSKFHFWVAEICIGRMYLAHQRSMNDPHNH